MVMAIHRSASAQWHRPDTLMPKRLKLVLGTGGVVYAGTLIGLSQMWYKDYEQTPFHFFNDNAQWAQIDKFGHAYTAYIFGKSGIRAMRWAGVKENTAIWVGGMYGFVFLTSIEILDGHYKAWGASVGDMAANATGAMFVIGQELAFGSQVMTMKFSYHPTEFPDYRPEVLGKDFREQVIKDYNGQTYWFSFNMKAMTGSQKIPKWFNVAFGYGATGLLTGKDDPAYHSDDWPEFKRYRSLYFSLDLDLDRIKTRSKFLNSTLFFLNMIKIPMPTIEWNPEQSFVFHPIYF